jgi:hypothetical protein
MTHDCPAQPGNAFPKSVGEVGSVVVHTSGARQSALVSQPIFACA